MDSTTINVEIEKINPEAEEASQGKIIVCRLSSSFFFLFTLRDLSPFFHSTTNPKSLSLSCAIDNDATIMTFIHICCLLLCFVPLTIYLGTSYVNAEVESVAPSMLNYMFKVRRYMTYECTCMFKVVRDTKRIYTVCIHDIH